MGKVDLDVLRTAKPILEALQQMLSSAGITLDQLFMAQNALHWGWFCMECGEEQPSSGWLPLFIHAPDRLSSVICNDCHDRLGDEAKKRQTQVAIPQARDCNG